MSNFGSTRFEKTFSQKNAVTAFYPLLKSMFSRINLYCTGEIHG